MVRERILLVEDESLVAISVKMQLEELSYVVVGTCGTGADAVAMAGALQPDLVLMEIVLEGPMDGIAAAELIHQQYTIPVVYVTAYADDARIEQAKLSDSFGYIVKPCFPRELHAVITLALYRAKTTRELQLAAWTSATLMGICDAVITLDTQGRISSLNPAAERLLLVRQADVAGAQLDGVARFTDRRDSVPQSGIIARVVQSGELFRCHHDAAVERRDGTRLPVHFSASPISDESGMTLGVALVVHDDSARRNAEQAMQDSERKFRTLAESTNAVILVYRDKFLYVNTAAERVSGYTQDELLQKSLADLVHPDYREMIVTRLRQRLAGDDTPQRYQIRILTKSGTERWVEISAGMIDFDNKPAGVATAFDITDQKRKEKGMLKLGSWAQRLINTSTDEDAFYRQVCAGIVDLVDADLGAMPCLDEGGASFTYRGAAGARAALLAGQSMPVHGGGLCGWVAAHGLPLSVPDLFADARVLPGLARALDVNSGLVVPLIQDQIVIGGLSAFRKGWPFDAVDLELLTLYGQRVALALSNLRLLQSLEQRVSERTAQLARSNDELEAFSYSVSHDLRAPLRGIEGFSQALLEDYGAALDEQGRDYLQRVRNGAARMSELIDDLLALSRVSRSEMNRGPVDLSALATTVTQTLQARSPQRSVAVEIVPGLSAEGDARLLQIALENLLGNAWKFTRKQPQPRIEFGVTRQDGMPIFFVRDNGAGFDMTHAGKLFGAFERLHADPAFEGTGIGLATVRRVIQRHGGKVWAEGKPGQGATFYFTL